MNDKGHYHSYDMGTDPPKDLPVEAVVRELSWLDICWAPGSGRQQRRDSWRPSSVIPEALPRAASGHLSGSWTVLERFYMSIVPA